MMVVLQYSNFTEKIYCSYRSWQNIFCYPIRLNKKKIKTKQWSESKFFGKVRLLQWCHIPYFWLPTNLLYKWLSWVIWIIDFILITIPYFHYWNFSLISSICLINERTNVVIVKGFRITSIWLIVEIVNIHGIAMSIFSVIRDQRLKFWLHCSTLTLIAHKIVVCLFLSCETFVFVKKQ